MYSVFLENVSEKFVLNGLMHAPGPDSRKLDLIREEAKVGQEMCEPATIPGSSEEMGFLQLC